MGVLNTVVPYRYRCVAKTVKRAVKRKAQRLANRVVDRAAGALAKRAKRGVADLLGV